jgi:hypothetical protein
LVSINPGSDNSETPRVNANSFTTKFRLVSFLSNYVGRSVVQKGLEADHSAAATPV